MSRQVSHAGAATPTLMRCCALLTLALLVAWIPVVWYASAEHGMDGIVAASLAVLVCWVGAASALAITAYARGNQAPMIRLAVGMALRMGVPLVGGVLLSQSTRWNSCGVFGLVVIFYLVGLAVETPLSLKFIARDASPGQPEKAI